MKNTYRQTVLAAMFLLLPFLYESCQIVEKEPDPAGYPVYAIEETDPVSTPDDAADDPCIWYNEKDPGQSRIIGTNKQTGLVVYDLEGNELSHFEVGRVNNVDLRYKFTHQNDTVDIVGATNRTYNSISLFQVDPEGQMKPLSIDNILSKTEEVYGFCFYQDTQTGDLYANLVAKSGDFEQYHIVTSKTGIQAELVRGFNVGGQSEGMVADDELGHLYIGEENLGIWKYGADPGSGDKRTKVDDLSNNDLAPDIEGLTLYYAAYGEGYLIASSQGNNSYAVYQRGGINKYLGSFYIGAGEHIDRTSDTDGIDVINLSLGNSYKDGLFIVQDGYNHQGEKLLNQNFKIVSWADIANCFDPPLTIDPVHDFRRTY